MGQLMETIQAVARGQEVMAKMQEEMSQQANAANPLIPPVVENLIPPPPPQVDPPMQIGALGGVPHVNLYPPVVEIDDQHDAFFSPRVAS